MTINAVLSLGGNVGDRKAVIDAAVNLLAALPQTTVTARSSYYRTEPDGPIAQDWFLNIAVAVTTALDSERLTAACRGIEAELGRDRTKEIPRGPRPIDIDVIATGGAGGMTPNGDRLDQRPFVMVPLAEIAAEVVVGDGTLAEHAAAAGASGVIRLDWPLPPSP